MKVISIWMLLCMKMSRCVSQVSVLPLMGKSNMTWVIRGNQAWMDTFMSVQLKRKMGFKTKPHFWMNTFPISHELIEQLPHVVLTSLCLEGETLNKYASVFLFCPFSSWFHHLPVDVVTLCLFTLCNSNPFIFLADRRASDDGLALNTVSNWFLGAMPRPWMIKLCVSGTFNQNLFTALSSLSGFSIKNISASSFQPIYL